MRTVIPAILLLSVACTTSAPAPAPVPSPEPVTTAVEPETAPAPAPLPPLKITFVDVDEGDAVLIQSGDFDALVDTGPGGAWDGQLEAALATVKGPLELLFVSHPHEDHLAQGDGVFALPAYLWKTRGKKWGLGSLLLVPAFVGIIVVINLAQAGLEH